MSRLLEQISTLWIGVGGVVVYTSLLVFDEIGFRYIGSVLVQWFSCTGLL
ncbi:hypothetical protein SAMN02745866_01084 [Alteromonadaceae bacterium Bs31]|nr:hypothetical protein SAMN02745866_01084 [Alteromonadaceae bacterium Bs31]